MALTSRAYVIVELETSSWKCAVSREVIGMDIIDIISFRPSPTVASDMHMLLNWEYLFADICGVGGGGRVITGLFLCRVVLVQGDLCSAFPSWRLARFRKWGKFSERTMCERFVDEEVRSRKAF